jgi:hypothetical protein
MRLLRVVVGRFATRTPVAVVMSSATNIQKKAWVRNAVDSAAAGFTPTWAGLSVYGVCVGDWVFLVVPIL